VIFCLETSVTVSEFMQKLLSQRETLLQEILDKLKIPSVLFSIISSYWALGKIQESSWISWKLPKESQPCGLATSTLSSPTNAPLLYMCDRGRNQLLTYSLKGELVDTNSYVSHLGSPGAVDIIKDLLYIIDVKYITVINIVERRILNRIDLPFHFPNSGERRGLKVDPITRELYYTICGCHKILVSDSHTGTVVKRFGLDTSSSELGCFDSPFALTLDFTYLYICDCNNHRIQIIEKENGKYFNHFKLYLNSPFGIYLDGETLFVGDQQSIHLFTKDGNSIQRIDRTNDGGMRWLNGLILIEGNLYVSDCGFGRIGVFKME